MTKEQAFDILVKTIEGELISDIIYDKCCERNAIISLVSIQATVEALKDVLAVESKAN